MKPQGIVGEEIRRPNALCSKITLSSAEESSLEQRQLEEIPSRGPPRLLISEGRWDAEVSE